MTSYRVPLLLTGLLLLTSCASLNQLGALQAPEVTFREAKLVGHPGPRLLLAHFCPKVLGGGSPWGIAGGVACTSLVGPPPLPAELEMAFDVGLGVANPNRIPLPIDAILTAVTVFPEANHERLGTACVQICPPGDNKCVGGSNPKACQPQSNDVRGIEDFPRAVANLLEARSTSTPGPGGRGGPFTLPSLAAGSSTEVVVRFAFLPERLLPALEPLARQAINQVRAGRPFEMSVPYKVEGTLFAGAGSLGRVAAAFGPVVGAWPLEGSLTR